MEPNAGHPREEGLKVLKIEKERGFQLFRFNQRHGSGDLQSILYSHICSSMLFFDGQQEQQENDNKTKLIRKGHLLVKRPSE